MKPETGNISKIYENIWNIYIYSGQRESQVKSGSTLWQRRPVGYWIDFVVQDTIW